MKRQRAMLSLIDAMGITDLVGFGDPDAGPDARWPLAGIAA